MSYHHFLLVLHLLAAAVWVGGHLLLLISYVPQALKKKDKHIILHFESRYEKTGMTALVTLVVTGIAMAINYAVMPTQWFTFSLPVERVVSTKLLLLLITVLFAISAQKFVIPKLKKGSNNIIPLVVHIIGVTTAGVLMLILGSFVRFGGI